MSCRLSHTMQSSGHHSPMASMSMFRTAVQAADISRFPLWCCPAEQAQRQAHEAEESQQHAGQEEAKAERLADQAERRAMQEQGKGNLAAAVAASSAGSRYKTLVLAVCSYRRSTCYTCCPWDTQTTQAFEKKISRMCFRSNRGLKYMLTMQTRAQYALRCALLHNFTGGISRANLGYCNNLRRGQACVHSCRIPFIFCDSVSQAVVVGLSVCSDVHHCNLCHTADTCPDPITPVSDLATGSGLLRCTVSNHSMVSPAAALYSPLSPADVASENTQILSLFENFSLSTYVAENSQS